MLLKKNFMKSNFFLCLLFNLLVFRSDSQVFFINLNDSLYIYNEKVLSAGDKNCYVLNCLSRNFTKRGNISLKPLILFKAFGYTGKKSISSKPTKAILFKDYVNSKIVSKLNADMLLKAHFEMANSDPNFHVIDSLIIYDGNTYQLIEGGVFILEFFNVSPYKQKDPIQTNQSVLNTSADTIKVSEWVGDHLPIPNIDEIIDGRMFLLKKEKNDYTFFRHPFDCSDCPLSFYNEYVYRKGYGIIAFKSKYLFKRILEYHIGNIGESKEYYYFR